MGLATVGTMTPDGPDLLVVYGTLLSGLGHTERLGVAGALEVLGPCTVRGALYEIDWYPGFVAADDGVVTGELVRVADPGAWAVLDHFEECDPSDPHGSEYVRVVVDVTFASVGTSMSAWIYRYNRDVTGRRHIASGDWRAWTAARSIGRD